jgi:hypothetical protein
MNLGCVGTNKVGEALLLSRQDNHVGRFLSGKQDEKEKTERKVRQIAKNRKRKREEKGRDIPEVGSRKICQRTQLGPYH